MEILEKATDYLIWQEEHEKVRDSHSINGDVLAVTTDNVGMLHRKGKIYLLHEQALKKMVFEK